jgi:hypothetical protein
MVLGAVVSKGKKARWCDVRNEEHGHAHCTKIHKHTRGREDDHAICMSRDMDQQGARNSCSETQAHTISRRGR